jgi:hypothetical protein
LLRMYCKSRATTSRLARCGRASALPMVRECPKNEDEMIFGAAVVVIHV